MTFLAAAPTTVTITGAGRQLGFGLLSVASAAHAAFERVELTAERDAGRDPERTAERDLRLR